VTWNRPLHLWLILYGCHNAGVMARVAAAPWGPWSAPTLILGQQDGLGCHVIMAQQGCPNLHDFWPDRPHIGKVVAGSLYAPFVLDRYTTAATSAGGTRSSTIYWLVSTWNPYEVTIMRTTLQVADK
jgi:hypothetical protein